MGGGGGQHTATIARDPLLDFTGYLPVTLALCHTVSILKVERHACLILLTSSDCVYLSFLRDFDAFIMASS